MKSLHACDHDAMAAIRALGPHLGKAILFGYDRYVGPEVAAYRSMLSELGRLSEPVSLEQLHYLSSAEVVCSALQAQPDAFGVLCCGTGIGMSIAANKFAGIYAARCLTVEDAETARIINNANVLCIAAFNGFTANSRLIEAFARTPYRGRKLDELSYITTFEDTRAVRGEKAG